MIKIRPLQSPWPESDLFGLAGSGTRIKSRAFVAFAGLLSLFFGAAPASGTSVVPVLWGTDEDTGHLVRVEEYGSSPQVTDYGLLSIDEAGTSRPFTDTDVEYDDVFSDIESFALNDHGVAYMVGNSTVEFPGGGSFASPHLYKLRIYKADGSLQVAPDDAAASGGYNALQSLGAISGISSGSVNGIDFDPISGSLFAVVENSGRDDLVIIDPLSAGATMVAASMDGTDDIEDIQFDESGNLYLIDDDGGVSGEEDILLMATLDRSGPLPSLSSIGVVNNTGGDHRFESIGWDFMNDRLVAFSDESNILFELNTTADGYTELGAVGFNDVEGIDFVPTSSGLPVPEPTTVLLFGLGFLGLGISRRGKI